MREQKKTVFSVSHQVVRKSELSRTQKDTTAHRLCPFHFDSSAVHSVRQLLQPSSDSLFVTISINISIVSLKRKLTMVRDAVSTLISESAVARQLDEMQQIATDYRMLEAKLSDLEILNQSTAKEAATYRDRALATEAQLAELLNNRARNEKRNDLLKGELKRTAELLQREQRRMEGESTAMAHENSELRMNISNLEICVAEADAACMKQREIAQKFEEKCVASETKQWHLEKKVAEYSVNKEVLEKAKKDVEDAKREAAALREQTDEATASRDVALHTHNHVAQELETSQNNLVRATEELNEINTRLLESQVTIDSQSKKLKGFEALRSAVDALEKRFTQEIGALEEQLRQANEQRDVAEERARVAERRQILSEAEAERDRCKLTHQLQSTRIRSEHAVSDLQKEQCASATLRSQVAHQDEEKKREREHFETRLREESERVLRNAEAEKAALERQLAAAHSSLHEAQDATAQARAESAGLKAKMEEQNIRFVQDRQTWSAQSADLNRLVETTKREASSREAAANELQTQLLDEQKANQDLEQKFSDLEMERADERERRAHAAKMRRELMEDRVRLERAIYQGISKSHSSTAQFDSTELAVEASRPQAPFQTTARDGTTFSPDTDASASLKRASGLGTLNPSETPYYTSAGAEIASDVVPLPPPGGYSTEGIASGFST